MPLIQPNTYIGTCNQLSNFKRNNKKMLEEIKNRVATQEYY